MVEFVDPDTGEAEEVKSKAESRVVAMLTPLEVLAYQPYTPEQIEEMIFDVSNRLERVGLVIVALYEEVHRAQEVYQLEFSKSIVKSPNGQISFAREYARAHTADEFHALNLAKEKLRYAEEMQKSLTAKSYALMNVNKAIIAQFGMSRRG